MMEFAYEHYELSKCFPINLVLYAQCEIANLHVQIMYKQI